MAEAVLLETTGLTREFNACLALDSVDLRAWQNSMHALIGPNRVVDKYRGGETENRTDKLHAQFGI